MIDEFHELMRKRALEEKTLFVKTYGREPHDAEAERLARKVIDEAKFAFAMHKSGLVDWNQKNFTHPTHAIESKIKQAHKTPEKVETKIALKIKNKKNNPKKNKTTF